MSKALGTKALGISRGARFGAWIALCAAAGIVPVGSAHATAITLSAWTPQFVGIDEAVATFSNSVAYIERINLTAPGIGFTVTGASGSLDTTAQTTSQFLLSTKTQVAINASFFSPCCNAAAEPKTIIGLSVSNGHVVSPANYGTSDAAASLLISAANQARIVGPAASGPVDLSNVFNAVSGNLIVTNGVNTSAITPTGAPHDPFGLDPRTDVGLSKDGHTLFLVAIDGRQKGYSTGVTTSDAANLLISLGAYEGLNLDGGGSTALVESNGKGGATLLDKPSGGTERYDGNNLGVYAESLAGAVPEPSTWAMLLLGFAGVGAMIHRRATKNAATASA